MLCCKWFCYTVLTISTLLLVGCGSLSSKGQQSGGKANSASRRSSRGEDRSLEKTAAAHAHFASGVIHDMADEPEAALQDYYQAALNDPDAEGLILEVSRRFLQAKQTDKAIEILSRAAAKPNASGLVLARLGFVYSQLGKNDQALAANRLAVNKSPGVITGYQNLFLNCLQNKQPQEALKVVDEAFRQPNPSAEFLIGVAELYADFGMQVPTQKTNVNSKALAALNRAEKLNPSSPPVRLKMADDYVLVGDPSKAAQIYLDLLKKLPDVPLVRSRVHARLTDIYLRSDDRKRAQEQLEAIVREDPTNPQAYYFLGSIAYDEKNLPAAADYFNKTILMNKEFEQAYYELALVQLGLDKAGEALQTLERAQQKFSKKFVSEFITAMAYNRRKEYSEAIRHYTEAEIIGKATETNRLDQNFYFQLGATYERKGDLEQAEKYFEKCLEISPSFPEAENYLGYMWAEHGVKLEKARELIQRAVKAKPNNAAYLDSMGWVLFKMNQHRDALGYILKAVELSEEPDATVYDHLGDIYAALKDSSKAREAWQKSFSLEANDQVRKKLEGVGAAK